MADPNERTEYAPDNPDVSHPGERTDPTVTHPPAAAYVDPGAPVLEGRTTPVKTASPYRTLDDRTRPAPVEGVPSYVGRQVGEMGVRSGDGPILEPPSRYPVMTGDPDDHASPLDNVQGLIGLIGAVLAYQHGNQAPLLAILSPLGECERGGVYGQPETDVLPAWVHVALDVDTADRLR